MAELFHSIGAGDWLQVEAYFTDEYRRSLTTIYWCGWAGKLLRPCLDQIPAYEHVEHVRLDLDEIGDYHHSISSTKYHAVLHRLPFTGSSLLKHQLADLTLDLPDKYDFVHLTTPYNDPAIRKLVRDVQPQEWQALLDWLESRDTIGVVVNSAAEPIPDSPRLLDLSGKTTMPQAVELLKRASGYIGIDSCFAILAAQLFQADDLLIRTRNPWVDQYRWWFYAPHTSFPFLTFALGNRPYPERPLPPTTGVYIQLAKTTLVDTRVYQPFEVVEVTEQRARREIELGNATLFTDEIGYR